MLALAPMGVNVLTDPPFAKKQRLLFLNEEGNTDKEGGAGEKGGAISCGSAACARRFACRPAPVFAGR